MKKSVGSTPAQVRARERKLPHALAGGGEDRVAHGGRDRWEGGLAEAGRGVFRLEEMHLDLGWRVGHANHRIFVVITLHDAAVLDVEFLKHQCADAVDNGAFDLVFGAAEVDDLLSDVTGGHDTVDL